DADRPSVFGRMSAQGEEAVSGVCVVHPEPFPTVSDNELTAVGTKTQGHSIGSHASVATRLLDPKQLFPGPQVPHGEGFNSAGRGKSAPVRTETDCQERVVRGPLVGVLEAVDLFSCLHVPDLRESIPARGGQGRPVVVETKCTDATLVRLDREHF